MAELLPQSDPTATWQRTVLIVDDEDLVRAMVSRSLREDGYHVMQACHGAAALSLLETDAPRIGLVICDLVMPSLGGREVSEWMKEHCPDLPLLFISGYPRAYLEANHLYDPSVPMLRKPFLPSKLLESVQELLADRRAPSRRRVEGI